MPTDMNEEYEAPIYGLSYGMVARVSVALGGILAVAVVNAAMWEQPFLEGR